MGNNNAYQVDSRTVEQGGKSLYSRKYSVFGCSI